MTKSQERLDVSVLVVANCNLFSSKQEFAGLQIRVFIKKNYSLDIVKLPFVILTTRREEESRAVLCEMPRSTEHDKCNE